MVNHVDEAAAGAVQREVELAKGFPRLRPEIACKCCGLWASTAVFGPRSDRLPNPGRRIALQSFTAFEVFGRQRLCRETAIRPRAQRNPEHLASIPPVAGTIRRTVSKQYPTCKSGTTTKFRRNGYDCLPINVTMPKDRFDADLC